MRYRSAVAANTSRPIIAWAAAWVEAEQWVDSSAGKRAEQHCRSRPGGVAFGCGIPRGPINHEINPSRLLAGPGNYEIDMTTATLFSSPLPSSPSRLRIQRRPPCPAPRRSAGAASLPPSPPGREYQVTVRAVGPSELSSARGKREPRGTCCCVTAPTDQWELRSS